MIFVGLDWADAGLQRPQSVIVHRRRRPLSPSGSTTSRQRRGCPVSKNTPNVSILTANRLGDGIVVFLDFEGAWSESIAEAASLVHPTRSRALAGSRGSYDAGTQSRGRTLSGRGPRSRPARLDPIRYRERVRVGGPSILDDVPGYVAPVAPRRVSPRVGVRPLSSPRRVGAAPRPRNMYRYDEFDAEFVRQRVAQFRDQVDRRASGELTEDEFKPLRLMNGVYLQLHAYMLRIAVPYGTLSLAPDAQARPHRPRLRSRHRPFHHAPEPAVQLAEALRHPRHPARSWPRSRCTPSRPPAIASAMSRPIILPAPPPTRLPIRAPTPRSSASGRRCIPSSASCRASSRSPSPPREHDRAAIQVHDIGLHLKRLAGGGLGFAVYVGGGMGRTPFIAKLIRDDLPEDDLLSYLEADPARLQSAGPARQQVQGAHQDPGARDRRGRVQRAGRGGVAAHPRRRAQAARRRDPPHRRLFCAARFRTTARARRRFVRRSALSIAG